MKQRIITATVALAIFIPIVILGGIPFIIFTYLLAAIGLYELLNMRKQRFISFPGLLSLAILWIILWPKKYIEVIEQFGITKIEFLLIFVLIFLTYTVLSKNTFTFDDVGFSILSALYVGVGFYFLIETREAGITYVFFALLLIWATDTGAYFIGRSLGKRKLWPAISPNKTVGGALGGIVSAVVVILLFAFFTDISEPLFKVIVVTIILSIFGQIGDLVESALKRHYDVKDSGFILPGHGGILDRFDSLLFVLPILHFLQFI